MNATTTPFDATKKPRLVWIDIDKAIGLFFIIAGHLTFNEYRASKYIYWFHVPFFFLISGLLHSSAKKIPRFIGERFKHLMVPYCVLVCCALIMVLTGMSGQLSVKNLLLGGQFFANSAFMKWWFIPCLFFTQVAGSFIIKTNKKRFVFYVAFLSYYAAEMMQISNTVFMWEYPFVILKLPLSLEIVPMALVFYLAGFLLRDRFLSTDHLPLPVTMLLSCPVIVIILLDWFNIVNVPWYYMYVHKYGLPLFNIIIPLIFFFLIRELSIALSRFSPAEKILSSIGRAALPIMFLHMILSNYAVLFLAKFVGLNAGNLFVRAAFCVLLPWGLYYLLLKNQLLKKLVLGEWH